jgi:hypothetical protein
MKDQPDVTTPFASATTDEFLDWWNGSRQAIHHWLEKQSSPLAELYFGAGRLLCEKTPGWTRFVGHAVREIVNRLPAEICGEVGRGREAGRGRLEYDKRVEALAVEWPETNPRLADANIGRGDIDVVAVLPLSIWKEVDRLIQDHRDISIRNRERALRMLQTLVPESPPGAQPLTWSANRWIELGYWAAGRAHDQTRCDEEHNDGEIIGRFEALEEIILSVTRPFFENKDDLDELLEETNA